jgi:succinoglycan biosynthesis transport protein ExoP
MNDVVSMRRIASGLVKWWWLLLFLTTIGALAGFLVSLRMDPVYEATTSVVVGRSIQATSLDTRDIQTSERLALSYADIARRQPILEATNVTLDLGYSWQDLRRRVHVELIPDTQLLEISVESGSREEAIVIADEIARQLVLLSPSSNMENQDTGYFVQQRLESIQANIETSQARLDLLTAELLSARTAEERALIQGDMDSLEERIISWEDNYAKLLAFADSGESANYLTIVEKAHASFNPVRPVIRLNTIVAGIAGLAVALGIVFLLEYLDDTLKGTDDISRDLNLIPLGSVGQFKSRDALGSKTVAKDPFSPLTESYRMIRNNIQYMSLDKPGKTILVTSPAPGDGKSVTAANLGIVMAFNGQRTIIVDTDLRKPNLHNVFQLPNARGLTNKLRDSESQSPIPLMDTEVQGLQILTAGDLPPNPSELLGSQKMEQLIAVLMEQADVLIFDCPPVAYIVDAAVLSKQVDGVVLVVSAGRTRRDVTRQAVFNLQQAGANILGVILNRVPDKNGVYKYRSSSDAKRSEPFSRRTLASVRRARSTLLLAVGWRGELRD